MGTVTMFGAFWACAFAAMLESGRPSGAPRSPNKAAAIPITIESDNLFFKQKVKDFANFCFVDPSLERTILLIFLLCIAVSPNCRHVCLTTFDTAGDLVEVLTRAEVAVLTNNARLRPWLQGVGRTNSRSVSSSLSQ